MALTFARHEKISLKSQSSFSEAWLQSQICNDTSLLGLGELDVIERERPQQAGGRLDMLLADSENNVRYEVEIMLGSTDPSHIIRCIEYWDVERRHYPAYDHVAVLIAEEITTRFLNVMSLLAGSIPLIAIQLNALKIGDTIILDFVKILDQRQLREDDPEESGGDVDRHWWEGRKGADKVQICDWFLGKARKSNNSGIELRYKKSHISLCPAGSFFNIVVFWPKQKFVRMRFKVSDAVSWVQRLEEAGLDAESPRDDRVQLRLSLPELHQHEDLIANLLEKAVTESD